VPTENQINHLFKRAGFGADLATIQAKAAQPLEDTVDELLDDVVDVTRPGFLDDDIGDWEKEYMLKEWWLDRMATSTKPLQEKLTLFWHGHFATENAKVGDMRLMWDQNNLFRLNGMGNFRQLVHDMSLQPAMLIYLDGAYNHKYAPNENFARELMELFTLGVNQYTQNDIVAAARAWTGHNIDDGVSPRVYEFNAGNHDGNNKTFMGQTRNWDGPDIIDYLLSENLAKKTTAAKFMTRKLWAFFSGSTPTTAMIDELAQVFLDSDLEIKPLLRAIFLRSEFYNSWSRMGLVRTPVEWVVAISKATRLPFTEPVGDLPHLNIWGMEEMGMDLFQPPNVAGWKNNAYWLGTTQYWARASWIWNYRWTLHEADFLLADYHNVLTGGGGDARYAIAVDNALSTFGVHFPTDNTRTLLINWTKRQYETPGEWNHLAWYYVTQLITLSPDFMMA
jgi:hypothetical protein